MNSLLTYILVPMLAWLTQEQRYEDSLPSPAPTEESLQGVKPGSLPPKNSPGNPGNLKRDTQTETTQAAMQWLGLLDGQQWGASWLGAGSLLKDVVSQNQWIDAIRSLRGNLGNASNRKYSSTQEKKQLTYGTRGDFAIVQFNTTFAKKSNMTETITLMTDGRLKQWRVISYSISRQQ